MATKGYLMLLGGMREIERILKERMHEDEETIEENGVCVLVESMADQIDELKEELKTLQSARPVEAKAEAGEKYMGHTPGPWKIRSFRRGQVTHTEIGAGEFEGEWCRVRIADVFDPANAQLIADAPLLAIRSTPAASTEGLRDAFESMVYQFAYEGRHGMITTGGLSALESAFDLLGWDDPHALPTSMLCDEPGCGERSTCGTPTPSGYRRVCGKHYAALRGEEGK